MTPEVEREGKKYSIVQGENGRHDVTDLEWRTVRTLQDVEEMLDSAQRNKADVFKSLEMYDFFKKPSLPWYRRHEVTGLEWRTVCSVQSDKARSSKKKHLRCSCQRGFIG